MAKTREYVKLWFSYDAYLESYTDEEVGRIVRAMIAYRKNGEQPNFEGNERFIWPVVKRDIDESRLAQERAAEISRENGKKGGRPRKPPAALPEAPAEVKTEEPEQEKPSETQENLNNQTGFCESKKKPDENKKTAKRTAQFTPPTLEEVKAYIAERKSPVDPQEFIDFYASKGWMVGKNKMKDWKAACRRAEKWDRWSKRSSPEKRPYTYEYRGIEDSL